MIYWISKPPWKVTYFFLVFIPPKRNQKLLNHHFIVFWLYFSILYYNMIYHELLCNFCFTVIVFLRVMIFSCHWQICIKILCKAFQKMLIISETNYSDLATIVISLPCVLSDLATMPEWPRYHTQVTSLP